MTNHHTICDASSQAFAAVGEPEHGTNHVKAGDTGHPADARETGQVHVRKGVFSDVAKSGRSYVANALLVVASG